MGLNPLKKIRKLANRSFLARKASEKYLSEKSFQLGEHEYRYLVHPHNFTWTNERAVEIPIAEHWIHQQKHKRILEVGNVTRHYFPGKHDVVDKYEVAPDVINVDIVEYSPEDKYNGVFAISTLEHVGWDRDKKEPDKIRVAVEKLKSLLLPNGELLITVPLGFNCFLDEFIEGDELKFDSYRYLKRLNSQNEWTESDWAGVKGSKYNSPFPNANAIVVARYQNS